MAKQLTRAAGPAALPTPFLPPRVAGLARSVKINTVQHPGQQVRHHLPGGLEISKADRKEMEILCSTFKSVLDPTNEFEKMHPHDAKLAMLTTMILGLAQGATNEAAAGAKFDLFDMVLGDVPAWAVAEAVKMWANGRCPPEVEAEPKYAFVPSPASFRGMALEAMRLYQESVADLERLLNAMTIEQAMDPDYRHDAAPGGKKLPAMRKL